MGKGSGPDGSAARFSQHRDVLVKLGAFLLLLGFVYRLFVATSVDVPTASDSVNRVKEASVGGDQLQKDKCDIFSGKWIQNPTEPIYTNGTCDVVEDHQNCMKNGRPDTEYLYWKWKPHGCELPRFDSLRFLEGMRNKYWAFVGDSILRNQAQSFICMLSQAEKATEVYRGPDNKSKRWLFPSRNFTVSFIWSPFLVKSAVFEDINGVSSSDIELHLDSLDPNWSEQYPKFDYLVITGGKWFLKTAIYYQNNKAVGCHNCKGKNLKELGFEYAYKKALQLIFDFIIKSNHNVITLFRTLTPDHFENGEWFSGGTCERTVPFEEGESSLNSIDKILKNIELEEFQKATAYESDKLGRIRLLDITGLSLLRPDGHPGPYRHFYPFSKDQNAKVQQDCLHWCLPGPIDTWNDLTMEMVMNK